MKISLDSCMFIYLFFFEGKDVSFVFLQLLFPNLRCKSNILRKGTGVEKFKNVEYFKINIFEIDCLLQLSAGVFYFLNKCR